MPLAREFEFRDGDGFYAALVTAHDNLTAEASAALNARLVLLLANHIGEAAVLREAIARASAVSKDDDAL